jgi:hypothetical protein
VIGCVAGWSPWSFAAAATGLLLPENRYATWFCRLWLGQIDLATHKFHVASDSSAKENSN